MREEFEGNYRFLNQVADASPAIIYVLDLEQRKFIYINATVKELLGYDKAYVLDVGADLLKEIVQPHEYGRCVQYMASLSELSDAEIRKMQVRLKVSNNDYRWFRVRDRIFKRDASGKPIQSIGIANDIHEAKMAKEEVAATKDELVAKNKQLNSLNSELKTFTTVAASDYNETLRNLYTNLEYVIVHDAANLSGVSRINIRRAQAAIQKMKLLTEDIVSYARLHEIEPGGQQVDLNDIIKNVVKDLEKKIHDLAVKIECKNLPHIIGYPFLVSLVFQHLIENAIKFRKENTPPEIVISCEEAVSGVAIVHEGARQNMQYHIVSVADNGIGFGLHDAEVIFNVFHRLHNESVYKGSGIGLAICRKIMELHDGFIVADGRPGFGAVFHCYFPAR